MRPSQVTLPSCHAPRASPSGSLPTWASQVLGENWCSGLGPSDPGAQSPATLRRPQTRLAARPPPTSGWVVPPPPEALRGVWGGQGGHVKPRSEREDHQPPGEPFLPSTRQRVSSAISPW